MNSKINAQIRELRVDYFQNIFNDLWAWNSTNTRNYRDTVNFICRHELFTWIVLASAGYLSLKAYNSNMRNIQPLVVERIERYNQKHEL